jgi:hypothetical protein
MWGVLDKRTIESYGENILNVHSVIPSLLDSFDKYNVKATFATVGFMFLEDKKDLYNNLPEVIPNYVNRKLTPYDEYLDSIQIGQEKYYFCPDLIRLIKNKNVHEIGTHTFSHYYCLEKGQDVLGFEADIKKAKEIAKKFDIEITSLVFPKNQFNERYMEVCIKYGITCYRANEFTWIYRARKVEELNFRERLVRILDAYINISGYNCYSDKEMLSTLPIQIPSSRILRNYSKKLRYFEFAKLYRIKKAMSHAAKNGLTFHLWWHPHNFGKDLKKNIKLLENVLAHYSKLNKDYGFRSNTMSELAKNLIKKKNNSSTILN